MQKVGVLHYSAPPVIGGVENVILAHLRLFVEAGRLVTILAGRGGRDALPAGVEWIQIPELDGQHPTILEMSQALEQGQVPPAFEEMAARLVESLTPVLSSIDHLIVHNVFTKHFNLPLTAALFRLLDAGAIHRCIAWCHDLTWTSPNSRSKVHPGYPWDLLRTHRSDITYVAVSQERGRELAGLFGCPPEQVHVIYNGVDPGELLGLSDDGRALIDRLELWDSDLNLLMPVRVTQAKNIELALRVVAALREREILPKLVVTGPPDPHDRRNMEYFRSLLEYREQLGVSRQALFVYESGPVPNEPYLMELPLVAELFRVSDALFMPSHREGFGMPVVEAGLMGLPIFCSRRVPAALEIGGREVNTFHPEAEAGAVAELILIALKGNPTSQFRRRIRQSLTWQGLFHRQILPLLQGGAREV